MKKKLLFVSLIVLFSGSIEAWRAGGYHGGGYHGGYHGGGYGYRRGNGGAIAAGVITGAAVVGTTAAIASSNNANQDPYAKVDRYQANQDLAELKAENQQKEFFKYFENVCSEDDFYNKVR